MADAFTDAHGTRLLLEFMVQDARVGAGAPWRGSVLKHGE
jgi:hypothetical protein